VCSLADDGPPRPSTATVVASEVAADPTPSKASVVPITKPMFGDEPLVLSAMRRVQQQSQRETGLDEQFLEASKAIQYDGDDNDNADRSPRRADLIRQLPTRKNGIRSLVKDFPAVAVTIPADRKEVLSRPWRDGPQKLSRYGPPVQNRATLQQKTQTETNDSTNRLHDPASDGLGSPTAHDTKAHTGAGSGKSYDAIRSAKARAKAKEIRAEQKKEREGEELTARE